MLGFSDFVFWRRYSKSPEMQKYYFYSMSLFGHMFSIKLNRARSQRPVVSGISGFDEGEPHCKTEYTVLRFRGNLLCDCVVMGLPVAENDCLIPFDWSNFLNAPDVYRFHNMTERKPSTASDASCSCVK